MDGQVRPRALQAPVVPFQMTGILNALRALKAQALLRQNQWPHQLPLLEIHLRLQWLRHLERLPTQ